MKMEFWYGVIVGACVAGVFGYLLGDHFGMLRGMRAEAKARGYLASVAEYDMRQTWPYRGE